MAQLPERTHQPFKVCWIKLSAWYHRIFKILQETWLWTIRKYPKSEVFEMHSSLYAPVLYGIELLHNQHALYFPNTNFSSILSCAFWTDIKWSNQPSEANWRSHHLRFKTAYSTHAYLLPHFWICILFLMSLHTPPELNSSLWTLILKTPKKGLCNYI